MKSILFVALGGALGALLRHFLTLHFSSKMGFLLHPGVFISNILGCFAFGFAYAYELTHPTIWIKPFLLTGILGALTTFSSYIHSIFFTHIKENLLASFAVLFLHILLGGLFYFLGTQLEKLIYG